MNDKKGLALTASDSWIRFELIKWNV
jgi:hypothetical protein